MKTPTATFNPMKLLVIGTIRLLQIINPLTALFDMSQFAKTKLTNIYLMLSLCETSCEVHHAK